MPYPGIIVKVSCSFLRGPVAEMKGRFVWYELSTTDPAAAGAFYSKVVGWNVEKSAMPGMDYWMAKAGDADIAGIMVQPEGARSMGAPPMWLGYVAVENIDAAAGVVTASGGRVYMQPMDIPGVGRFAVAADPDNAVIALFSTTNPGHDEPHSQEALGHVGWHELHAGNLDADFAFYTKLFGWEKKDAMDMGEMGPYQMFGTADHTLGGMMTNPPGSPAPPHWNYYFNVASIDKAAEVVAARGGQVVMGPEEVPGGMFIIAGIDPQGAAFALIGPK